MIAADPLYASMVVANLGSVGLDAAYHHLFERTPVKRLDLERLMTCQVVGADGATRARKIGNECAGQLAAIEIVEPGVSEMLKCLRKRRLLEQAADGRGFSVRHEAARKAGDIFHLRTFADRIIVLAARDRDALARVVLGIFQQPCE